MSFTVWVRFFVWNFNGQPLIFHSKYLTHTLRDTIVIQYGLRNRTGGCPRNLIWALKFKSSYEFLEHSLTPVSVHGKWHKVSICVVCPLSCVISIVTSEGNGQRSKHHTSLDVDDTQKAVYQSLHFLIKPGCYFTTQQQVSAVGPTLFLAELEMLTRWCANHTKARVRFHKILRGHPGNSHTHTLRPEQYGQHFQGTVSK